VRVVRHLALDTCPKRRRMAFKGLVAAEEGFVTTSGVMAAADCSKGTALGLLKDLVALRLAGRIRMPRASRLSSNPFGLGWRMTLPG